MSDSGKFTRPDRVRSTHVRALRLAVVAAGLVMFGVAIVLTDFRVSANPEKFDSAYWMVLASRGSVVWTVGLAVLCLLAVRLSRVVGSAFGWVGIVATVAACCGAVLGGVVGAFHTWQWLPAIPWNVRVGGGILLGGAVCGAIGVVGVRGLRIR